MSKSVSPQDLTDKISFGLSSRLILLLHILLFGLTIFKIGQK